MQKFLTKAEIAAMLRVHERTVERWLKAGTLKGHKLGDGKTSLWRISETEYNRFLKEHSN